MNLLFQAGSLFVLPIWFLMIFLPRWNVTKRIAASPWIAVGPVLIYAVLVLPQIGRVLPAVSHPTLTGIQALLSTPIGATLGWSHFLAFDVLIGRWIYLDAQERGLSPWLASPVLCLTLMLGPLGYLCYLCARSAKPFLDRYSGLLHRAHRMNTPLFVLTMSALALLVVCVGGMVVDHRVLLGVPIWLKPAKFAISSAVYAGTMLWILSYAHAERRVLRALSWMIVGCFVIEDSLIVMQAVRGTESHFNIQTRFDVMVYSIMGMTILILWLTNVLAAILLIRSRVADAAFGWSLKIGLGLAIVGMAVAFLMTQPTSAQLAGYAHGQMDLAGSHTVGGLDGGPGLPGVNWSTRHGDLRVPHFIGLHALQILPLIGWLLTLGPLARLPLRDRVALVWTAGAAYLGAIGVLTWQALRGQSVTAPDLLTVTAVSTLLASAAMIAGVICIRGFAEMRPATTLPQSR